MKKPINILAISISIVVLFGILFGAHFLFKKESSGTDVIQETSVDFMTLLMNNSVSELKTEAKEKKIELNFSEEYKTITFTNLSSSHIIANALFNYKEDNIAEVFAELEFSTAIYDEIEDKSILLKEDIEYASSLCSDMFGVDLTNVEKIFHNDGYILDQDENETYIQVLKREAYMMILVKENSDFYWEIVGKVEDDRFFVYLSKICSELEDEYADIVLEQE